MTKSVRLWVDNGIYTPAQYIASPNQDARPDNTAISLIVIHNISLPPGEYGGPGVEQLFTNRLDANEHPYYAAIAQIEVSAHFFIRRNGQLIQFVPCDQRAWHAGLSSWQGRDRCNEFSIGIELEGCDHEAFTTAQYQQLHTLILDLLQQYPIDAIAGHEHIAPGRKTDPGPHFEWAALHTRFSALTFPKMPLYSPPDGD